MQFCSLLHIKFRLKLFLKKNQSKLSLCFATPLEAESQYYYAICTCYDLVGGIHVWRPLPKHLQLLQRPRPMVNNNYQIWRILCTECYLCWCLLSQGDASQRRYERHQLWVPVRECTSVNKAVSKQAALSTSQSWLIMVVTWWVWLSWR